VAFFIVFFGRLIICYAATLKELRERVAAQKKAARHLLEEKGDRIWTDEDQKKFDNLADETERG
jgi:uncharacterized membrane protein